MKRMLLKLYVFIFLKYFSFLTNLLVIFFMTCVGLNFFQITMIYALTSLSVTIFEIPTGIIADRYSRKYSILAGMALDTVLTLSLLILKNFYLLLIWAFLDGLGFSLSSGAIISLVYDNMKYLGIEGDFPRVQSNYASIREISILVGGFASGFVAAISFDLAIYLSAVVIIISILTLLLIKEYPYKPKERERFTNIWKNSIFFLRKNHTLIHMIVIFIFIELFLDTLMSLSQAYIYFIIPSLPIVTISLSLVEVSNVIGYKTPHKFQRKIYPFIPLIVGSIVIFLGLYHTIISLLFMSLVEILSAMFYIVWQTDFQKAIPSDKRSTLTSFAYFMVTLTLFIFYSIYGHIADLLGLFNAIFYTALVLFIIFSIYYVFVLLRRHVLCLNP